MFIFLNDSDHPGISINDIWVSEIAKLSRWLVEDRARFRVYHVSSSESSLDCPGVDHGLQLLVYLLYELGCPSGISLLGFAIVV